MDKKLDNETTSVKSEQTDPQGGPESFSGSTVSSTQNTSPKEPSNSGGQDDSYPFHDYTETPEVEEFVYKPRTNSTLQRVVKFIATLASMALIIGPLIYLITKIKPKGPKTVATKGEIVWWSMGLKKEIIQPLIDDYQKDNPDAKITYVEQSQIDYRERLASSLSQGKGPDIFEFHNSWIPMFKNDLDLLPKSTMSQDEFAQTFYPVIVRDLMTPSGVVGIPLEYDAITLFTNEDIFSSAGKVPPRTWDQFHQLAIDLTTRGDKGMIIQSGAAMGLTGNVDYWSEIVALLLLQNKASLLKPSGSGAEEAMAFYADFYSLDKTWDSTLPSSTQAFAEGKAAMFFAPIRAVDSLRKINRNLNFKTVTLPQVRRDDPTEPDVSYATYWAEGVWAKSGGKELAWDFLKFLSKKESLEKIYKNSQSFGLSGEPYPRVDMRDALINNPVIGSVLALAPSAKSGFLASYTNDGIQGINSTLSEAYATGINTLSATKNRNAVKAVVDKIAADAAKVYLKFGISPQ